jgi:hypothetical protein
VVRPASLPPSIRPISRWRPETFSLTSVSDSRTDRSCDRGHDKGSHEMVERFGLRAVR